ncbi:MAG: hypothetical protein AB1414_20735 [bacterium]
MGKRPELTGGGLVRSVGGWSEVLALMRRKKKVASDSRILGSSDFVEAVLKEAEKLEIETLRLKKRKIRIEDLYGEVAQRYKTELTELDS